MRACDVAGSINSIQSKKNKPDNKKTTTETRTSFSRQSTTIRRALDDGDDDDLSNSRVDVVIVDDGVDVEDDDGEAAFG